MAEIEVEIIFELPEGQHDAFDLMEAVFEAGLEDAVVGTGVPGVLAVTIKAETEGGEDAILGLVGPLLKKLPKRSVLREVLPDLLVAQDPLSSCR